jgi:ribonucleotide monophosphatase NagD (HAD superfamily)
MIDMQMGNAAGIRTILVLTGYGKDELELCRKTETRLDYVAPDLFSAMQHIKQTTQTAQLPIS